MTKRYVVKTYSLQGIIALTRPLDLKTALRTAAFDNAFLKVNHSTSRSIVQEF